MADVRTPTSLQDQASLSSPVRAQTLPGEAVFDALKMILLGAPLNEILTSVTHLIEAHSKGMLCSIFLVEKDGLHLRYAGASNLPEAYRAATDGMCIGPNVGSCGAAAYLGEPVFIPDILSHPNWANYGDVVLQSGLRAAWSAPILSHDGKVLGTFCMYYREVRHPAPADIELIDHASRIAAIAIERDRSQEVLRIALGEIQNSELKLKRVIDTIPALVWCGLPDGSKEFVNKQWCDYTGLSSEESYGWGWQVCVHPEDLPRLLEEWRALVASGKPGEMKARVRRYDGTFRWFLVRSQPLRGETGKIVKWYGTTTDIETLMRTEEKLREDERELRRITDAIPQAIVVLDGSGAPLFANQTTLDYTGLTIEDLLTPGFRERIFHPDDLERLRDERKASLARGIPFEIEQRALGKDGKYRWFLIRYNPFCDEQGRVIRWYATGTDIDDRKQSENKLRQEERELRQLIDFLPQHVLVLDKDGTLLQVNKTMLDYKGLTLEEMKGGGSRERINRDVHPDDLERVQNERSAGLSKGVPFETEKRLLGKDGQFRWFLFRYNPVLNEAGNIVRWFATATDVEDRKQAEDRTRNEAIALREQIDRDSMFEDIVGSSEALGKVLRQVAKVALSNSTVLILGETGTGKELIARAIHKRSNRAQRAFIGVNCASIAPSLIASELFGYEKGAFTGATQRHLGRFESANGGTIFLDEIGDLPPEIQIALLRVLQERHIERVGSNKPISIDVRVLAATHRDLNALVAEGKFRRDLLYRVNVVPIELPSLSERAADIPLLVEYFIDRFGKKAGKKFRAIDKRTLKLFQAYGWPGNVRELQNVVERAVILSDGDTFSVEENWLKPELPQVAPTRTVALNGVLQKQEKEMIEAALAESHGRISGPDGAAAKLALPAQTLEAKIKRLGINKYRFKAPQL
ncbi:MAG TPA: sigma 54-interacting transcriptional regulator [Terriglobales bacterium]|nr:sigma 54-interacting transcriptional regulator [Terriglobales bacterium]